MQYKNFFPFILYQNFVPFMQYKNFLFVYAGSDGEVRFFITDSQPPESQDLFAINRNTGQITVARPLDYETVPAHQLTVTVRDSAVIPRETSRVFTVHLTVGIPPVLNFRKKRVWHCSF